MLFRLKLYTYHTFLVVPFMVLFLYAHNPGLSKVEMTYRTLLLGSGICLLCYFMLQRLFRNRLKTGVFVTILLFGMFQYGVLYEILGMLQNKGFWPFEHVHRFLLSFYLLLFIALFLVFKRTAHDFIRINYFLNFLLFLLLLFNLGKVIWNAFYHDVRPSGYPVSEEGFRFSDHSERPDIYFIILDGFASRRVLRKFYNSDHPAFYEGLQKLGFRFCDSAFSNYYSTTRSLSATLNMRYETGEVDALEALRNNRLFSILKQNQYRIYHLRSGYVVTRSFALADSVIGIGGPNEFELSLLRHTVLRLDDAFGFFAVQRLRSQFRKMNAVANISPSPKFCFIHIVAPHPPFVFERDGRLRSNHFSDENLWEPETHYVDQLVYVADQVLLFMNRLIAQNPAAVVVLQSDHGPYGSGKSSEEIFESRAGILYAYRAPGHVSIPGRTSSINTFPYLLNGLFGTGIPYLRDLEAGKAQFMRSPVLFKKLED